MAQIEPAVWVKTLLASGIRGVMIQINKNLKGGFFRKATPLRQKNSL